MSSYSAKVTSKGQLTLPVDLRREWRLEDGDMVEFVRTPDGSVRVWPRNLPPSALFGLLAHLKADPAFTSDEEAVAAGLLQKDEAGKSKSRRTKAA